MRLSCVLSIALLGMCGLAAAWLPRPSPHLRLLRQSLRTELMCAPLPTGAAATDAPPPSELKVRLTADMKAAMKSKEKERLAAIRAISTAIKQIEVDERKVVGDAEALAVMAKLVKTRRESITSYAAAGRPELAAVEEEEIKWISTYMPAPMSSKEIDAAIKECIARLGATSVKDMGKVMGELRGALSGKADMADVGARIKKLLS